MISATILTGGTGSLGNLIAAGLLAATQVRIVMPVRKGHKEEDIIRAVSETMRFEGIEPTDEHFRRLMIVPLPPNDQLHTLEALSREQGVEEIIHCAGSLSYYDAQDLQRVNIEMTRSLLNLGHSIKIQRFIYISTAFSCGYVKGLIREQLHPEPTSDPTEYTKSKREAEWVVARSGVPFIIVRPSIVIGDSRDGHYRGKPYGIYKIYHLVERFVSDEDLPRMHFYAPNVPLSLLHQDAFQKAFLAAYRSLPAGSIIHIASKKATLPTLRDTWKTWLSLGIHPEEIYFYSSRNAMPWDQIPRKWKDVVDSMAVNADIAAHEWDFELTQLDRLKKQGLDFGDCTNKTFENCVRFVFQQSAKYQSILKKYEESQRKPTKIVEVE